MRTTTPARSPLIAAAALVLAALPLSATARAGDAPADLMLARDCKRGQGCTQTWTLTSRLGHILESYEKHVGHRNRAYRLLGIEFTTGPRPRIWYPDFGNGASSLIVQLTNRARQRPRLALFQLAHEAFHLIEPVEPGSRASVFEEGLASFFAARYLEANAIPSGDKFLGETAYLDAYRIVAALAARYPDFDARLRRLRKRIGSFSKIDPDELRSAFPAIAARDARLLASPFTNAPG